jgi:hypothetical protein
MHSGSRHYASFYAQGKNISVCPDSQIWKTCEEKKSKSQTMPHPRRASASAPPDGWNEGGQCPATWDEGGNDRGCKQRGTRPAANGVTNRHCCTSNRGPNQQDIAGNKRAHSNANRARTSGQEAERIQELPHAKAADSTKEATFSAWCTRKVATLS